MARKFLSFLLLTGLSIVLALPAFTLEKARLGSPVKTDPAIYLQPLAAEDGGFWKENGLEVEWVPFASGAGLVQAIAAGEIKIATHSSSGPPPAAEKGLPVVMVAEMVKSSPFILSVRGDSPYRHPRELKGRRIAVNALGSAQHVFALVILKAHGMEKDVRFVGAGSPPAQMAGLKVGAFEAMVSSFPTVALMKVEGKVREIASSADFVPKPWVEHVVFARKDYLQSKPDVVRKMVRALLQATDFIRKNPRWAIDKMKSFQGFSEEAARAAYDSIQFTTTGRLEHKAVENARNIFIEYGIITAKAPAVDDLFTNEYLP